MKLQSSTLEEHIFRYHMKTNKYAGVYKVYYAHCKPPTRSATHEAILRDVHYKGQIQGHITEVFERMQIQNVKFKKYM